MAKKGEKEKYKKRSRSKSRSRSRSNEKLKANTKDKKRERESSPKFHKKDRKRSKSNDTTKDKHKAKIINNKLPDDIQIEDINVNAIIQENKPKIVSNIPTKSTNSSTVNCNTNNGSIINDKNQEVIPNVDLDDLMFKYGFSDFDSSKNKSHMDTDLSGVFKGSQVKRKYRQYMNRKGGFNRALDSAV